MPELTVNYSEGWGLPIKPNACLQAMCFPVSPSRLFQLSSVATSLTFLDGDAEIAQGLTKAAVDGEAEFLITAPVMRLCIFRQRRWMRTTD